MLSKSKGGKQMSFGVWSLFPVLIIIVFALWTKDTFISIFIGVIVAFMMHAKGNPIVAFNEFLDTLYKVMTSNVTAWVLLVCGLFGSLIMIVTEAGGVLGFSNLCEKFLKTRKAALLGTWLLGIIVCVDDYLNSLAVGAAVRKVTDREKVSREMVAFIVNSTGVTVCAIVPFSSWAAFMGGLMKKSNMLNGLSPLGAYIHSIPYMIYGWFAIICVPLFILKIIPLFGPMKLAEKRALETGEVFSEESKNKVGKLPNEELKFAGIECRAVNFIAPILLVAVLTVKTEDLLLGIFAALALCFVMYIPQKLMTIKGYFDNVMNGLKDMFPVLVIIILSYVLIDVNGKLGLVDYVVGVALKTVHPALLPVTVFVVIGLLSFASGSFWGLAAISFPIVGPLSEALGVNPFLCAGALISAVAFGGHICIYSDTVILASASTQVSNAEYFQTSAPLVGVSFIMSIIGFLAMGFLTV